MSYYKPLAGALFCRGIRGPVFPFSFFTIILNLIVCLIIVAESRRVHARPGNGSHTVLSTAFWNVPIIHCCFSASTTATDQATSFMKFSMLLPRMLSPSSTIIPFSRFFIAVSASYQSLSGSAFNTSLKIRIFAINSTLRVLSPMEGLLQSGKQYGFNLNFCYQSIGKQLIESCRKFVPEGAFCLAQKILGCCSKKGTHR